MPQMSHSLPVNAGKYSHSGGVGVMPVMSCQEKLHLYSESSEDQLVVAGTAEGKMGDRPRNVSHR